MVKKIEKLDKLKRKQEALNARIEMMEAAVKAKAKKQDTRRKILLGAYFLEQAAKAGEVAVTGLYNKLDGFLTRNSDRVLFDLPLLANGERKIKPG